MTIEQIPANTQNYTIGRGGNRIEKITLHHMAAVWTARRCGESFQNPDRKGSSHYGIGFEGEIAQYVGEENTAWTDGDWQSNQTSVTIECANAVYGAPWPLSEATVNSLVWLIVDISRRNGLGALVKGENLTWHQMYAATACPGESMLMQMDSIIERANALLQAPSAEGGALTAEYQVYTERGGWLPLVRGYNPFDAEEGFAGILGQEIEGIYATLSQGDIDYRVHTKNGRWLPVVKNREDFAGILGQSIDGVMLRSDSAVLFYRVHTAEGGWLPEVNGWNTDDSENGFAGILGQSIDGFMLRAVPLPPKEEPAPPVESEPKPVPEPAPESVPKPEPETEPKPELEPEPEKKMSLWERIRHFFDDLLNRLG